MKQTNDDYTLKVNRFLISTLKEKKREKMEKILHDLHQIFLSIKCYYKIFYRIIKFNDTKTKKKETKHNKTDTLQFVLLILKIISCFVFFPVRNVKKFNIFFLLIACDVTRHDMQFLRVVIIFFSSFSPLKVCE